MVNETALVQINRTGKMHCLNLPELTASVAKENAQLRIAISLPFYNNNMYIYQKTHSFSENSHTCIVCTKGCPLGWGGATNITPLLTHQSYVYLNQHRRWNFLVLEYIAKTSAHVTTNAFGYYQLITTWNVFVILSNGSIFTWLCRGVAQVIGQYGNWWTKGTP